MPINPRFIPLLLGAMLVLTALATVAGIGNLKQSTSVTIEVPGGRR